MMGRRGRDYGDVRRQCSDFANGNDCTQRCVRKLGKPTGYSLAYLSRLSITEPHKIKHWKESSAMVSTTDRFASEKKINNAGPNVHCIGSLASCFGDAQRKAGDATHSTMLA